MSLCKESIMGWRIIEVSTEDNISLYLNNLLIKRGEKKIIININDIDMLLVDNTRINLSVQLMNALVQNNAIIILFNNKHEPSAFVYAVEGNHMSLKILEKQISWNNQFKGRLWKEIIKNKISNQYYLVNHVASADIGFDYFTNILNEVKEFDVTNREGHFAKVYWHAMFGIDFIRDQDGNNNAVINSMLNYGYAILRGMVIKSIVKKGLDPRIAVFHKSFSNFYALASDLMEPFRPLVDKIVFNNRTAPIFTVEIRQMLVETLTEKVFINDKQEFINNAIDKCVDSVVAEKGWSWVDIWK